MINHSMILNDFINKENNKLCIHKLWSEGSKQTEGDGKGWAKIRVKITTLHNYWF